MEEKNNGMNIVREIADKKYEYGFTTDVHTDIIEKGLNEDVVRLISEKKGEPDWLLEFRLKAFRYWQTLKEPHGGISICLLSTIRTSPTMQIPLHKKRPIHRKKSTLS